MILILKENRLNEEYRLHSFHDLTECISENHPTIIYGQGAEGFREEKTIQDVIDEECGGNEPEAIVCMHPRVAKSDFTKLKCPVYLMVFDSIRHKKDLDGLKYPIHTIKPKAVFHNYLYKLDHMKTIFDAPFIYFPPWASRIYDYMENIIEKNIEFFLSGTYSKEYSHRKFFHKVFHKAGFNCVDNFIKKRVSEKKDNDNYRNLLLRSRWSPHDGGINGRLVARYMESGYARSPIISPDLGEEMKRTGFEHGLNCVLIDRGDSIKNVRKQLMHLPVYSDIALNSYNHIAENHTTTQRTKQLLEVIL